MPPMDPMMGGPPLPPMIGTPAPGSSAGPTFAGLSGGTPAPQTAGMGQVGAAAVKMAAEIDAALKLLAQSIPTISPWVEKTVMELRQQIGMALNSGAVPTSPVPSDIMPDGSNRL